MDKFRNYDIAFAGLKPGGYEFSFEIGDAFLTLFDTDREFAHPKVTAVVSLLKHSTFLEIWVRISGTVELICDISTDNFDHPVENEIKVLVKFGDQYDDSDPDVITIPKTDHAFNVAHLIYENIALAIPMKKISPNVSEEDLKALERFSVPETEAGEQSDPRWEALKKLKDKN